MRRLKKTIYFKAWAIILFCLALVRLFNPSLPQRVGLEEVTDSLTSNEDAIIEPVNVTEVKIEEPKIEVETQEIVNTDTLTAEKGVIINEKKYHRINSVHSYKDCFPDVQSTQIVAARHWGVSPVLNRVQAEQRKGELVYVGSSPYFRIDKQMSSSIPYLVPRAAVLLEDIGRAYLDSLAIKGVPLHKIIVTSVLRTEEDVKKLMHRNGNASDQSCHRFGTTFDICYNRYQTVCPPGEYRRAVTNDTLKWVLSEVLRDQRQAGRCYIKYEVKQGCFHITTR